MMIYNLFLDGFIFQLSTPVEIINRKILQYILPLDARSQFFINFFQNLVTQVHVWKKQGTENVEIKLDAIFFVIAIHDFNFVPIELLGNSLVHLISRD